MLVLSIVSVIWCICQHDEKAPSFFSWFASVLPFRKEDSVPKLVLSSGVYTPELTRDVFSWFELSSKGGMRERTKKKV